MYYSEINNKYSWTTKVYKVQGNPYLASGLYYTTSNFIHHISFGLGIKENLLSVWESRRYMCQKSMAFGSKIN